MRFLQNISWLTLLVGALSGGIVAGGWQQIRIEQDRADLAGMKATFADEKQQASEAANQRFIKAVQRADTLTVALEDSEQHLTLLKKEKDREIKRLTSGNVCLNAATVRLLNHQATGAGSGTAPMPTPISQPVTEDAAIATDTDVAEYINTAQSQYNVCRARLDALIDWHLPDTTNHD
jgi:hypothetical protein